MKEFWVGVFGAVLGVLAGFALVGVVALFAFGGTLSAIVQGPGPADTASSATDGSVLEIDIRADRSANDVLTAIEALHQAENDPSVLGAIIYVSGDQLLPLAHSEALSHALAALSQSGKPLTGFLEDGGSAGLSTYLAISQADDVWASPLALIRTDLRTPSASIAPAQLAQPILERIARARGLQESRLIEALQAPLVDAHAARSAGLIDQLGSAAAARAAALAMTPEADSIGLVSASDYVRRRGRHGDQDIIALISLHGSVTSALAADTVSAIETAARDEQVRAVILHVEGAGGSMAAAYEISDSIRRAQATGTPVVVLTGAVATGPAYYAVSPASRIVTSPFSALVGLGDADSRLPPALRQASSDQAAPEAVIAQARYALILEQIADARDLPLSRLATLGRGQVWTGSEAVTFGLADMEGGLGEAVAQARSLSGLSLDEPVLLVRQARPSSQRGQGLERLIERMGEP